MYVRLMPGYMSFIYLSFFHSLNHKNTAKYNINSILLPHQDNFLFCLRNRTIWFSRLPSFISRHETIQFGQVLYRRALQFTSPHVTLKQEEVNVCNYRGSSVCKWNRWHRRPQGLGCCSRAKRNQRTQVFCFYSSGSFMFINRQAGEHCRRQKMVPLYLR